MNPKSGIVVATDSVWASIHTLAEFAQRASEADGYALYEWENDNLNLVFRDAGDVALPDPTRLTLTLGRAYWDGITIISYPLRGEVTMSALLIFNFCSRTIDEERLAMLDRLSNAVEAIYRQPQLTRRLVSRITDLEVELAGIKINERTRGLLANGRLTDESVQTVVGHVERVLRRRPAENLLKRLQPELEDEVAERRLVVKAKQLLQDRDRISEEQAYLWLIKRSRMTRKRLRDVAKELIAGV